MATGVKNDSRAKRVLMLTNSERGEANVFLATSHALFQADPEVEIHFASFAGLENDVASISEIARLNAPQSKPITYHKIGGKSTAEVMVELHNIQGEVGQINLANMKPPSLINTSKALHGLSALFVPYSGPDLLVVFNSIVGIIKLVAADLVIVDSFMTPGLTACFNLDIKCITLSPNSIKEFASALQPGRPGLWKFPALFSGYRYPVPWYLIPFNIYFVLTLVVCYVSSDRRKKVESFLAENGITLHTPISYINKRPENHKVLVSTLPELDFPLIIPSHVIPCGPIIRHAQSISESDPDLQKWLARGPTIYVNLGSLAAIPENMALEFSRALRVVFDEFGKNHAEKGKLQVIWKLKKMGNYDVLEGETEFSKLFQEEIKDDRIRILKWIQADPLSILRAGNILCSIHHGGANSYNEAVLAGVPHVVLPAWTDCYDYAQRAELHGIGRWGNAKVKVGWTAKELSQQVLDVIVGKKSSCMREKAKHLAEVCVKNGDGAANAARHILQECESP